MQENHRPLAAPPTQLQKSRHALPSPGSWFRDLRQLIDRLYDEILIYDADYRQLYVNKACERHCGFTREEMLSLSFHDAVNQYDRGWLWLYLAWLRCSAGYLE